MMNMNRYNEEQNIINHPTNSKYLLGFANLFNSNVHGNFNKNFNGKYFADIFYDDYNELCYEYNEYRSGVITWEDFYSQELVPMILLFVNTMKQIKLMGQKHSTIKNYLNIINSNYYSQPQILEVIEEFNSEIDEQCQTHESIPIYTCILKTCYLRIFQRKWKNYYKKKMDAIQKMKNPRALYYRTINGKVPKHIRKEYYYL